VLGTVLVEGVAVSAELVPDAVNLDRDGDGSPRPADCEDGNARVHPGARDKPRTVGVVARCTVRAGKPPALRERCLRPGAKRPTHCPA
jgi:hypothetical protein